MPNVLTAPDSILNGSRPLVSSHRSAHNGHMDLFEEFIRVVSTLQQNRVEFAVCGGIALALHGHPRFTKDIDLLVRNEDIDRIVALVKPLGFDFDAGVIPLGVQAGHPQDVRRVTKVVGREWISLDLLIADVESVGLLTASTIFSWQGHSVPGLSALGLAKMKRRAGRPQDLIDIEKLGFNSDDASLRE